jgi:hypothetical protein
MVKCDLWKSQVWNESCVMFSSYLGGFFIMVGGGGG